MRIESRFPPRCLIRSLIYYFLSKKKKILRAIINEMCLSISMKINLHVIHSHSPLLWARDETFVRIRYFRIKNERWFLKEIMCNVSFSMYADETRNQLLRTVKRMVHSLGLRIYVISRAFVNFLFVIAWIHKRTIEAIAAM